LLQSFRSGKTMVSDAAVRQTRESCQVCLEMQIIDGDF
jgi:hypothetical protein